MSTSTHLLNKTVRIVNAGADAVTKLTLKQAAGNKRNKLVIAAVILVAVALFLWAEPLLAVLVLPVVAAIFGMSFFRVKRAAIIAAAASAGSLQGETDVAILIKAAKSPDSNIRSEVARNTHTPPVVLADLLRDEEVADLAASNMNLTEEDALAFIQVADENEHYEVLDIFADRYDFSTAVGDALSAIGYEE